MSVMETIKNRRSIRSYKKKEVSKNVLEEIINCARLAPSARNRQDWKFILVRDDKLKNRLVKVAHNQQFVEEAPVVIAGVALNPDDVMSCQVPTYAVDLAIAMDHITLAAREKGLGTCWIGAFVQQEAKKVLQVPEKYKITALMTLGYPDEEPSSSRKNLEEVLCYNKFSE